MLRFSLQFWGWNQFGYCRFSVVQFLDWSMVWGSSHWFYFIWFYCHHLPSPALNPPLPQMLTIPSHNSFRCTECILRRGPRFLCFWTGAAPGRLEILWSHHNHKGKGQIWIKRSIFCSCFVFSFAFTPGNFGSLHLCLPHAQSFSHWRCPLVVINEWLMQPNSWNKKIPEARPYGVKTWSAERQSSGSSYDFIKSLSPICPISISLLPSPSFLPPPTPFLLGLTQEVHCCLWLDEVFPQTHVFLTPQTDFPCLCFCLRFPWFSHYSFRLHNAIPFFILPTPPAEGNPWRRSNARHLCLLGSKITVQKN